MNITRKFIAETNAHIYDERTGKGRLRHLYIRLGELTDELMVCYVVNGNGLKQEDLLIKMLREELPNLKTVAFNSNRENTNVILGKKNIVLYGDGYIYDKLGNYIFKISPLSFYQINPVQTEKLYNLALQGAELTGNETVFDLYCGIGTIGIYMANHAKEVYGIEIVEQAIEDAKENCKINNIKNAYYYAGDTEKLLAKLIYGDNIQPGVIVVDPPRKGLDNTTIENMLKIKPERIVYISCNPATLVRDLAKIEEKYHIEKIQPVDMFPFTSHVECVVVLQQKIDK